MIENIVDLDILSKYDKDLREVGSILCKDTPYSLNQVVSFKGTLYICTTAGTTGSSLGSVVAGSTAISSGTVVFTKLDLESLSQGLKIETWQPNKKYYVHNAVINDGLLYVCTKAHTSSSSFSSDGSNWAFVGDCKVFVASTLYYVGQLVIYSNEIYRCSTTHVSGATFWADRNYWTLLYSNLSVYEKNISYKAGSTVIYDRGIYRAISDTYEDSGVIDEIIQYTNTISIQGFSNDITTTYNIGGSYDIGYFVSTASVPFGTSFKLLSISISTNGTDFETIFETNSISDIARIKINRSFQYLKLRLYGSTGSSYPPIGTVTVNFSLTTNKSHWEKVADFESSVISWQSGNNYESDYVVLYGKSLYKCIKQHKSSTNFSNDSAYWSIITSSISAWTPNTSYGIGDLVIYNNSVGKSSWVASTSYNIDDEVVYNDVIYLCTVANSDATFISANWTATESVTADLYSCKVANSDAVFTEANWTLVGGSSLASTQDILAMF